ncbi:MAG: GGDEF domain-containing protein [Bacillus sp. (in: Bacteria)]|nr:GGDEF domain-containing protein [Bacillus sp. (in: firmicutes)]
MEKQAYEDSLTGLYNRHYLQSHFNELKNGALFYLDLDGFKKVNDTLGHEMGDLVLKEVAIRINTTLRSTDIGVRLGGDEFILVFPSLMESDIIFKKAKEILRKMENWDIFTGDVHLSTSIGITTFTEKDSELAAVLKRADAALYEAKHKGKNNYQLQ